MNPTQGLRFKLESLKKYQALVLRDLASVWTPHAGQVLVGSAYFKHGKKKIFIRCGRKFGKALALDEEVITPNGFLKMADVEVGNEIYDEKGGLTTISHVWDIVTDRDVYEVEFDNGQVIKACEDHRWLTSTKSARKTKRDGVTTRGKEGITTTKEIAKTLMAGKEFNHQIKKAQPLNLPEKNLPIDPYLFGCWLGDGGTHGAKISSVDEEILEAFRSTYGINSYGGCDYGILGGFITKLKELGVVGKKFVPHDYLFGSIEQRLALLQGLMDTDGTINKIGNHACFDNVNEDLADAVFWLVSSLGMKPKKTSRIPKLKGKECKECFRVMFRPDKPVFRLKRKLERINITGVKAGNHTIVACRNIGKIPARCITVTNDSHLYLTSRSCIPTHNTELAMYFLLRIALSLPNQHCYYIAPTYKQARELVWENGRLPRFLKNLGAKYIEKISESEHRITFKNGSFIKIDGSDNFEAYRGINPHAIAYDEFKDFHPKFHEGMEPNLATHEAPIFIFGTPPNTEDHQFCRVETGFHVDDEGAAFKMPTETNPHISRKWLANMEKVLISRGEWHIWMREYMAEIVPSGALNIFPMFEAPKISPDGKFADYTKHVRPHQELLDMVQRHPRDYTYHAIYDPGSATCFAVLIAAVHRRTKQVILLDEIYETDKGKNSSKQIWPRAWDLKRQIHNWDHYWRDVYDHAAAWFAGEIQHEYAASMIPCTKDMNKKEVRLSSIKDFIREDLFLVSERCLKLIWEMRNYATDEDGKIPKKNDHLVDCVRYLFNDAGLHTIPKTKIVRIEDLREREPLEYEFEEDEPIDFDEEFTEEFYE